MINRLKRRIDEWLCFHRYEAFGRDGDKMVYRCKCGKHIGVDIETAIFSTEIEEAFPGDLENRNKEEEDE